MAIRHGSLTLLIRLALEDLTRKAILKEIDIDLYNEQVGEYHDEKKILKQKLSYLNIGRDF